MTTLLAALFTLVGCSPEEVLAPETERAPDPQQGASGPLLASPSWSARVGAAIAAGEYAPHASDEGFRSNNRAQGLRGRFDPDGVALVRSDEPGPEVRLRLQAWGREGALEAAQRVRPVDGPCLAGALTDAEGACLHRVQFERPGLVEWWENRADGLEQGFTVGAPAGGDGPLLIDLALEGAIADPTPDAATLRRDDGSWLQYDHLAAWDATGRTLPAWMEEIDRGLRLVVDDDGAIGAVTVDPLLTTASWGADPTDTENAGFSYTMAPAGDVNGDGFGDVVIGAPWYDDGVTLTGKVYVYHGSADGLETTAAWSAGSTYPDAYYGYSLASAGDLNGDGYSEVVIGDPYYRTRTGRLEVFMGSASGLATTPAYSATGRDYDNYLGMSVASAGDMNADGYGELAYGVPRQQGTPYGQTESGTMGVVDIVLGSATFPTSSSVREIHPETYDSDYGWSVASAGDVNGDGYGDLIVGLPASDTPRAWDPGSSTWDDGRVFVYYGSAGMGMSSLWTSDSWWGEEPYAELGGAVSAAGDVNGDGYGDVVFGAPGRGGDPYLPRAASGAAYVLLGSASGLTPTGARGMYGAAGDSLGSVVASTGDVNGDGYADVVVDPVTSGGVYLGSSGGLATSAAWQGGTDATSALLATAAGDVNGDGLGDVLLGDSVYDGEATDEGRAWLYLGAASGLATASQSNMESNQATAAFGLAVARAGDVNGDGYGDVIVGAPGYDNGSTDEGRASLFLGTASGVSSTPAWTAESDQDAASFGWSVAAAGDVNGDGYGDVIVGAYAYDNGSSNEGRAYVYLGSAAGLGATPAWTAESDQTGAGFGVSVASAGDVNGDGYGDVIVGAYYYDGGSTDEGRAYVYLGSTSGLATTAAWTAESDQASAYFGSSVASAGDVDGDGYSEVLVGAHRYDAGSTDEGKAYLFLGSPAGLAATAAWTATSHQADAWFGSSVASAADVNGDGYGDVAIGAYAYDGTATDGGRVFVYLGSGAGLPTSPAWTADGDQSGAYFGRSVGSAGDVNGDGFGDLIVGAPSYDDGSSDEGRACVYLGSATGLATTADWSAEPDQAAAYLGRSAASAGDVDGDGYSDVIVGAYYYDNGETNEGAAWVYLGNGADDTGPALSRLPQARQVGASTPIAPGLTSAERDSFDVAVLAARGPWGITQVALQVEVKPLGTLFDGTGLTTGATYTSSGLSGAALQQTLSGLTPGSGYHWRARVEAAPSQGRPQGWGAWMVGGLPGDAVGGHVYTTSATVYADTDGDRYGDPAVSSTVRGSALSGYVVNATDCDDGNAAINPLATEVCDAANVDEDCNGVADDADSGVSVTTKTMFYVDTDGDGYGTAAGAAWCDRPAGYAANATDCNDRNAAINPGATEVCDAANTDENCNGVADDADGGVSSAGKTTYYRDSDGDGYGGATAATFCDAPGSGYVTTSTDCNDSSASVHPGATEVCDRSNVDENCNGVADDADATVSSVGKTTYYPDGDTDGYGSGSGTAWCDAPGSGYATTSTDCNDASASINPGMNEVCDRSNVDENCNGVADDADSTVSSSGKTTYYLDSDADGYGSTTSASFCDLPASGYATTSTDCNDSSASINPGATEVAGDTVDQNCDGAESCYVDSDFDGTRTAFLVASADADCTDRGEALASAALDCDDASASVHPGATDTPGTGVDEDCDGAETCYVDVDGDGYRPDDTTVVASADADCDDPGEARATTPSGDCDDASAAYNPGAIEADCTDPADYNCDGATGYTDSDGDGQAACEECNDHDRTVYVGATELPGDGVDQDCDGLDLCYVDADGDGYRPDATSTVAGTTVACDGAGEARATDPTGDCDDVDGTISPAAIEVVGDGIDENCDGDESCWTDADRDGYRTDDDVILASADTDCVDPGEATAATPTGDCDDGDATVSPDAIEGIADGQDQDCDGGDLCYADVDRDGFGAADGDTVASADLACADPGESDGLVMGDCDDGDATARPDAEEVAGDGIDQDCDGGEVCYADVDRDGYTDGAVVTSADTDCADIGEVAAGAGTGDCDDSTAAYHPGAPETDCADPADYNCDGNTGYTDGDGDGYGACEECNDADPTMHPGATERVGDGIDQDCDGTERCYADADGDGARGTSEVASADADCADAGEALATTPVDCDDGDAAAHPGATEVVGDERDQDCDGDELCYIDDDNDGYRPDGDATVTSADSDCTDAYEARATVPAGDCDDTDAAYNPAALEDDCSDPADYNCDGASGLVDGDGDGFAACEECDDASSLVNPDADELCNAVDDNCDGIVDVDAVDAPTWYADADADGYTDPDVHVATCDAPAGYADPSDENDCDDTTDVVHPGAKDLPDDGIDQDCDGADATAGDTGDTGDTSETGDTGDTGEDTSDKRKGCGCTTDGAGTAGVGWLTLLGGLALAARRRRPRVQAHVE